jgi:hypothetical protein
MVNNLPAFQPVLIPPYPTTAGLRIFIGPPTANIAGAIVLSNTTIFVPTQFVNVPPISTTYIYLNLSTGTIQSNQSGFITSVYPIAIVITNATEVTTLADVRPDVTAIGGGGSGTTADTVVAYTTPQTIVLVANQNIFGTCIAAANPLVLPTVQSFMAGQQIKLIKIDGTAFVEITGAASGTVYLSNQYQYSNFECDGSNWYCNSNN